MMNDDVPPKYRQRCVIAMTAAQPSVSAVHELQPGLGVRTHR